MSNQTMIEATITLRPEAVAIIQYLNETRGIDEPIEKGRWQQAAERFPIVAEFAQNDRADFIPYGANVCDPESSIDGLVWSIGCSTADYDDELEAFLKLLPKIATAAEVDTEIEGFSGAILVDYELKDGVMVETQRRGKHEYSESWGYGF